MNNGRFFTKDRTSLILGGFIIGIISVVLVLLGNPKNMGFCIACFIRDISGSLYLHNASPVQYIRPEILGLVIGSFIISIFSGEFRSYGGSSPILRFFISAMVMIGALAFLGCPFRMILRLSAGDLNALIGFVGFIIGISVGCFYLNKGFNLGRYHEQNVLNGCTLPLVNIILLALAVFLPTLFISSASGPGSMHAPIIYSLLAGLLVGIISQKTRLCMAGGIRDIVLIKDSTLISGFIAIFVSSLIMNLATGNFKLGFSGQPVAHTAWFWNLMGMFIVGLGSALLGGCPLRQLILAGTGNSDSAISVLGMLTGAAFAHNFGLAGVAGTDYGLNMKGKIVVVFSALILLIIGFVVTFVRTEKK